MQTRRDFIHGAASAAGAVAFVGCDLLNHAHAEGAPRRREVVVSGKRVKTVDIHAHCAFPDVNAMMGLKVAPAALRQTAAERIRQMDAQGIDVEAMSINPFWYKADRDLAEKLIKTAEREACRTVRGASGPLRRFRDHCHAVSRPRRPAARIRREEARTSWHVGRHPCRRATELGRSEIPSDLGEVRGAWRAWCSCTRSASPELQKRLAGQWRSAQYDRLSARDHDRALALDLRRHARPLSRAQDLHVARRRLHRVLCATAPMPSALTFPRSMHGGAAQEKADRISAADLTTTPSSSDPEAVRSSARRGWREPDHPGHRLSVPAGPTAPRSIIILNTPGAQ